jgi:hypothetical protein
MRFFEKTFGSQPLLLFRIFSNEIATWEERLAAHASGCNICMKQAMAAFLWAEIRASEAEMQEPIKRFAKNRKTEPRRPISKGIMNWVRIVQHL